MAKDKGGAGGGKPKPVKRDAPKPPPKKRLPQGPYRKA